MAPLPPSPGESSRPDGEFWTRILIFIVIGIAAWTRFAHARKGLPYIHNYDEPQIASTTLHMLRTGRWNPRFFH